MIKISVVIPTYNRCDLLTPCILSVAAQDYFLANDFEIIVVDDCSTDNTERVVQSLSSALRNIRYIKCEVKRGANFARNLGVKLAEGDIIFFQDSDDFWLPSKVSQQIGPLLYFNADAVFTPLLRVSRLRVTRYPTCFSNKSQLVTSKQIKLFLRKNPLSTQCLAIRKDAFHTLQGFDESLPRFQDWELALRMITQLKVYFLDIPSVIVNESQVSITKDYKAGLVARKKILEKHSHLLRQHKRYLLFRLDLIVRHFYLVLNTFIEGFRKEPSQ